MTLPDGCVAQRARRRAPERCTACWIEPREAGRDVGAGDAFLAGYVAARYDGLGAGRVPALRRRVRRGVDPAPGRRAWSIRAGRRAAAAEVEVERIEAPPRPSEPALGAAFGALPAAGARCYRRRAWPLPPATLRMSPLRPRLRGVVSSAPSLGSLMEIEIGRGKKARRAYGFDDIAIVPSRRTRDPDDVDISWKLGPYRFELPLLASAMDGVVSPATATHRSASSAASPS